MTLIKNKITDFQLMGVLNITPDSFSDGGEYFESSKAIQKAMELSKDGANIIDLGAESTGPSSVPIPLEEEIRRLNLVFSSSKFIEVKKKIKISVDTYKAKTAQFAIENGASIINDVSGLRADPEMVNVIASGGIDVVVMFSKENKTPHVTDKAKEYSSIFDEISLFFEDRLEFCISKGLTESQIILDPGMGAFLGNNPKFSWEVVGSYESFKKRFANIRFLYGVSRKSFIKNVVSKDNLDFASKLIEFKLYNQGIDIIRTHNVGLFTDMLPIILELKS